MQTLSQIKEMLEARGLSPRKSLGQNFLIERTLITKLLDAAGAKPGDLVLEVGPGTGTLTDAMLERGCRVIACELDRGLAQLLRERLASNANFTLIEGDCLASGRRLNDEVATTVRRELDARRGAQSGAPTSDQPTFSLIANLPYQAATPLMIHLLCEHPACRVLAVTIQKEVADRLAAGPGSKDYGTLGIVAQAMAEIETVARLPPECFWPRPQVTSAMVVLRRRAEPWTDDPSALAVFCQELFSKRRKQLGAILGRDVEWPPGITPDQRPETLSVRDFVALFEQRKKLGGFPLDSSDGAR